MRTTISQKATSVVQFRCVQRWANQPEQAVKPGVYANGIWVGDIIKGNAYFPEQISINGKRSPYFKRKEQAKGNVKRTIRNALIAWAEQELNQ